MENIAWPTKPKILYLDDEPNNLITFKAAFRREYDIQTATSAEEALSLMDQHLFEVVISDQRMPGMTGVEFFKALFEKYPLPVRILLTGYADIESVIKAINEGHVYRYITKPWNEADLRLAINNALQLYHAQNEIKRRNIELQKAYEELEKFVYYASHDMRAPLASVLGIVKLAKMESSSSGQYLDMIEMTVKKLDVLLQNIISYYRNAKSDNAVEEINLEKFLQESVERHAYLDDAQHIRFTIDVKQEKPLNTDPVRLGIVLNNLISNAIRYQREDARDKMVRLSAHVQNGHAIIEVEDNGIGINPELQDKIFTMFYRSAQKKSGSGIGLYIVQDAVKKLNGKVEVTSRPGEGSKFTIIIPNQNGTS
ncbi:MAG: hybrid sensor histidine kinase/response regulator [Chitinophagales bacterium]|nr:MAG: hybrid sensor histidine kinase/response regulator [Chitinophagales bacterium]